ncbi:MAG TPA: hypothetical protein VGA28_06000 [Desulfurivibrionaceae bacterium]|jgi:hypothetical protein
MDKMGNMGNYPFLRWVRPLRGIGKQALKIPANAPPVKHDALICGGEI